MTRIKKVPAILALFLACLFPLSTPAQIDIVGPAGSGIFGIDMKVLPNGNIVVIDPAYDLPDPYVDSGAVYLFNGATGALISMLKGSMNGDNVGGGDGGGVTVLTNGDFVVSSPNWSYSPGGPLVHQVGAVTYCSAVTGCNGFISPSNSLIGTLAGDKVGNGGITPLREGNFLVNSFFWGQSYGAQSWRTPAMGTSGFITAENSLIGNHAGDYIGAAIVLSNGNYVVKQQSWFQNRGAVRLCGWSVGCTGNISAANSLTGTNSQDAVGNTGIKELPNGNFLVQSRNWNGSRGAVTLVNGVTGLTGEVSSANSLVGTNQSDLLGTGVFAADLVKVLVNGNYVVGTPGWRNASNVKVGAATFCNGNTGCTGLVEAGNSLIGRADGDFYDSRIVPLTNGNYVVMAPSWRSGGLGSGAATLVNGTTGLVGQVTEANSFIGGPGSGGLGGGGLTPLKNGNYVINSSSWNSSRGAITLIDGSTGLIGSISPENSLTGVEAGDRIGGDNGVVALANGNFVVRTYGWNSSRGAVTWCSGLSGCAGMSVSGSNSLIGTTNSDMVGYNGVYALPNGHYVVVSGEWSDLGAVTWCNGSNGLTVGPISASNSLIGDNTYALAAGSGAVSVLKNGNYIVYSPTWNESRGAVAWGSGFGGLTGPISAANSLVGSSPSDTVGDKPVTELPNNKYVIWSPNFDGGGFPNSGALTFANPGTGITGNIHGGNSYLGTVANIGGGLIFLYDRVNRHLVIRTGLHTITLFPVSGVRTPFDYDGDGKADISVFRPSEGNWYIQNSSDLSVIGPHFGQTGDLTAPGDFDGDGKADISVFRPSEGNWYRLNSSDGSFFGTHFGTAEDKPAVGDFDGDSKDDISVFRPSEGNWYRISSGDGSFFGTHFGAAEDKPAVGDFDGDGKADISLFRPSEGNWYRLNSSDGSFFGTHFGIAEDKPTPADYDGDGKTDISVFRPSAGDWFRLNSNGGTFFGTHFGALNDKPAAADFDGDGKADIAVFRPSEGNWYILNSTAGFLSQHFGATEDTPTPNSFVY